MKRNLFIITCLMLLNLSINAQSWDGGGDGTSWDDAMNWSNDLVPTANSSLRFPQNTTTVVTSSSATNLANRIIVDTNATVTFDLDLTLGSAASVLNPFLLLQNSVTKFGSGTTARTISLITGDTKDNILLVGASVSLEISSMVTLNTNLGLNGIRTVSPNSTITNDGTININGHKGHGFTMNNGTFNNNLVINIGAGTNTNANSDGFNIVNVATLNNTAAATINVVNAADDGIELFGTLNNEGVINVTLVDNGVPTNSGISVGTGNLVGTFNNMSGAVVNTNGGLNGTSRAFSIGGAGILNNDSRITLTNGNAGARFFTMGTLNNNACAIIDATDGRFLVNGGVFTNSGLYISTFTGPGINALAGTTINNGFYSYTTASPAFGIGVGTITNNGFTANDTTDAMNNCTLSTGLDAAANWYSDTLGQNLVGSSDASGTLTFNNAVFANAGTQVIYTCYGSAVALTVENVSGSCIVPKVSITAVVDMFEYTGAAYTTVYISGDFNGWNGTSNPLTDQGGNIWSGVIEVNQNDSIEYKFTLDDWTVQEEFAGGETCTKTSGTFTNRFLMTGATDIVVDTVCWESCVGCLTSNTESIVLEAAFEAVPNPADNFVLLSFDGEFISIEKTIFLRNTVGQIVHTATTNYSDTYKVETQNIASGLYFLTIQTEKGMQTKRLLINHK